MEELPQTPTSMPELPEPARRFSLKFTLLIIGVLVLASASGVSAWWWNNSLITIEGRTLNNVNGFPHNDGSFNVGYEWYKPVPSLVEGDELSITYKGDSELNSKCTYSHNQNDEGFFFCEAPWPSEVRNNHNYVFKDRVTFTKRISLMEFLTGRRPAILNIAGTPNPIPTPNETADWKKYHNDIYNFEFKYPPNAELTSYDDYGNVIKRLDPRYPISVNINSTRIFNVARSTIKQLNVENVSKAFASAPTLIEPILLPAGGGFKASFDSGDVISDFYFIQFIGHSDQNTYEITLPKNDTVARQILLTLKFVELDPTTDWQTYRNEKYRYSIRYPATLKFYPSSPNSDPVITGQGYTLCCGPVRITATERYVGGLWFLYPIYLSEGPNLDAMNRLVFEVHKPTRSSLVTIDQFFNGFAKNFPNTRKDLTINGSPAMRLANLNSESSEHIFTQTVIKGSEEVYVFTYFRPDLFNDVIETFETLGGEVCIQVITSARNLQTGEVKDFPTPCDVPEGWMKI